MKAERWQKIKPLLQSALSIAPDERANFLDEVCADDDSLRRELESLLESHQPEDDFIEQPALEIALPLLPDSPTDKLETEDINSYKIIENLGEGGMGIVYLAVDTRLGRKVALKMLHPRYSTDVERIRRFQQEARAVSALNHPNILTIHEIGQNQSGNHFIAAEFVEGETLRQKLRNQTFSLLETLEISIQIASALSAAHQAGIVHRDIKPENIMIRPDGLVKVLDFGLAKLIEKKNMPFDEAATRPQIETNPGVIMGTFAYMSPEQTRGKDIDARADIWSFGVLLYEMLTGKLPFVGETNSDLIAAILNNKPAPLASLVSDVPKELERLVSKTLRKDKDARYQTMKGLLADLKELKETIVFDEKLEHSASPKNKATAIMLATTGDVKRQTIETHGGFRQSIKRHKFVVVLLLIGLIIGGSVFWLSKFRSNIETPAETVPVVVKTTQLTTWNGLDFYPALSPDGKSIAFSSDRSGSFEIYLKQLVMGAREVRITADGGQNYQPAFSSDGSLIAYHSKKRGGIWIVPATGGTPKQLTEFGSNPAWSPNDSMIAFQSEPFHIIGYMTMNPRPPSTLWVVPSKGGEPRQLTQANIPPGGHGGPGWSPDGKRIAFNASGEGERVWSISAQGDDLKKISGQITAASDAVYAPDGKAIFFTADTGWSLYKVSISESGDPISEPVNFSGGSGPHIRKLAIAANGKTIAYSALTTLSDIWTLPLSPKTHLPNGKPVQLTQTSNTCDIAPAISPDGKTIAYFTFATGVPSQIWTMDAEGRDQKQITTEDSGFPWWFPDGSRIVFQSERENRKGLWAINVEGGKEKKLFEFEEYLGAARLSPDGKRIAFISKRSGAPNLWVAPLEGDATQQLTFEKEFVSHPAWSPDGKWIAFEVRRGEDTHVAIIPSNGGNLIQLTFDRGQSLVHDWSPDDERILFAGQRNGIWNVWSVSRSTKQQHQMTAYTKFDSYVRGPAWSPLGDKIVYEYAENKGNIWLMELK